jgi:hypothetical protein
MQNLIFGFEHLEHRYRCLCSSEPPHIPIEVRLNLSDILKERYGSDYAQDPKLKSLMLLNGPLDMRFLEGSQEAEAFKAKEFIRMNSSTISKVEFFRHAIVLALRSKLRTSGSGLFLLIDRLLESRSSRVIALFTATVGVFVGPYQIFLWLHN